MDLLAKLRQVERIPDAHSRWANYRMQLTHYIIENISDTRDIAIIGAGRCGDIDLGLLASTFETIYLLDKDMEAMAEGLKRYDLEHSSKIKLISTDLLGITDKDYNVYIEAVKKCFNPHTNTLDLSEILFLLNQVKLKQQRYKVDLGADNYTNTVLVGVYSQLNIYFAHIWALYSDAFQRTDPTVYKKIEELNHIATQNLNEALIKNTTDTLVIGYEDGIAERLGKVEGAIQGAEDLALQLAIGRLSMRSETTLLWPFKPGCTYRMKLMGLNK